MLISLTQDKFYIKYPLRETEIFTTQRDFNTLKKYFQDTDVSFHTYIEKSQKQMTFVIKGLHKETKINLIIKELKKQRFKFNKISNP